MNILVCAAKTGGHLFPALSFCKDAIRRGHKVIFLGSKNQLEQKIIHQAQLDGVQLDYLQIGIDGFRGTNLMQKIMFVIRLPFLIMKICWWLGKHKISFAIGFGGFIMIPLGFAIFLMRKKIYLHEQNAVMGSANRMMSRFAEKIFTSFPESSHPKQIVSGNPVQLNLDQGVEQSFDPENIKIFVVGGSQGSYFLNSFIPPAINSLKKNFQILHQCGFKKKDEVSKYKSHLNVQIEEFVNMIDAITWADLVICRCGAGTLAELSMNQKPMIMIPLPNAIDNHQFMNARFYEDAHQGILCSEPTDKEVLASDYEEFRNAIEKMLSTNSRGEMKIKRISQSKPPINHFNAIAIMVESIRENFREY